jgi:hypothetical protein
MSISAFFTSLLTLTTLFTLGLALTTLFTFSILCLVSSHKVVLLFQIKFMYYWCNLLLLVDVYMYVAIQNIACWDIFQC